MNSLSKLTLLFVIVFSQQSRGEFCRINLSSTAFDVITDIFHSLENPATSCAVEFHTGLKRFESPQGPMAFLPVSGVDMLDGFTRGWNFVNWSNTRSMDDIQNSVCNCANSTFNPPREEARQRERLKKDLLKESVEEIYLETLRSRILESMNQMIALESYASMRQPRAVGVSAFVERCEATSVVDSLFILREKEGCNRDVFDSRMNKMFGTSERSELLETLSSAVERAFRESEGATCGASYSSFYERELLSGPDYIPDSSMPFRPQQNEDIGARPSLSALARNGYELYDLAEQSEYYRVSSIYDARRSEELGVFGFNTEMMASRIANTLGRAGGIDFSQHEVRNVSATLRPPESILVVPSDHENFLKELLGRNALTNFSEKVEREVATARMIANSPIYSILFSNPNLMESLDNDFLWPFCRENDCENSTYFNERLKTFIENADSDLITRAILTDEALIEFAEDANGKCERLTSVGQASNENEERGSRSGRGGTNASSFFNDPIAKMLCQDDLEYPSANIMRKDVLSKMLEKEDPEIAYEAVIDDAKDRLCIAHERNGYQYFVMNDEPNEIEEFLEINTRYPSYLERTFLNSEMGEGESMSLIFKNAIYENSYESYVEEQCSHRGRRLTALPSSDSGIESFSVAQLDSPSSGPRSPHRDYEPSDDTTPTDLQPSLSGDDEERSPSARSASEEDDVLSRVVLRPEGVDFDREAYNDAVADYQESVREGRIALDEPPPHFSDFMTHPETPEMMDVSSRIVTELPDESDSSGGSEEDNERDNENEGISDSNREGDQDFTSISMNEAFSASDFGFTASSGSSMGENSNDSIHINESSRAERSSSDRNETVQKVDEFYDSEQGDGRSYEERMNEIGRRMDEVRRNLARQIDYENMRKGNLQREMARRNRQASNNRQSRNIASGGGSGHGGGSWGRPNGQAAEGVATGGGEEEQRIDESSIGSQGDGDNYSGVSDKITNSGGSGGSGGGGLGGVGASGGIGSEWMADGLRVDEDVLPYMESKIIPHQLIDAVFDGSVGRMVDNLGLHGMRFYTLDESEEGESFILREYDYYSEEADPDDEEYRMAVLSNIARKRLQQSFEDLSIIAHRVRLVSEKELEFNDARVFISSIMARDEIIARIDRYYSLVGS